MNALTVSIPMALAAQLHSASQSLQLSRSELVRRASMSLADEITAVQTLFDRCHNVPASLADVCLVRMSELYERCLVFTLDAAFWGASRGRNPSSPYIPTNTFKSASHKEVAVPQITLYLDATTQTLVEQAASANEVSRSHWVADLISTHAANDWPAKCLAMAGRLGDLPLRDEAWAKLPGDVQRIGF